MTTNPFEVLRLDPTATEEDVVRQAERLRQRAADEAALGAIRQAAMALTGRPEERALHALLTHPRPGHASAALDRFAAVFRRAPAPTAAPAPCPDLDADEFRRLLLVAAAEELDLPPAAFDALPGTDGADEVRRQWAEALWQSLLFDPRA
jgi:hypothetical protein